jgi:TIR domain/PEGA domain
MSDRIFISYAREDQTFVFRLARELRTRGISIWLDQWDISPGADWNQSIDRALRETERFIVILSPAAVTSRQVRAEIQAAIDTAKAVFPVLYKDCEVPRVIRLYQFIDFRDDHEYSQRLERLAEVLHGENEPLPPPYPSSTASKIWRRLILATAAGVALVGGGLLLFIFFFPFSGSIPNDKHQVATPSDVARGTLQVNVNVDAARVSVDGTEVGIAHRVAPLILLGLAAGDHRLRVEADGYQPQERRVNVGQNNWLSEGFILREQTQAH